MHEHYARWGWWVVGAWWWQVSVEVVLLEAVVVAGWWVGWHLGVSGDGGCDGGGGGD